MTTLPRRDLKLHGIGQSNLTNYANTTYEPPAWREATAANVYGQTQEANCMGAALVSLGALGWGGIWAKHAVGGQAIQQFAPGGTQYTGFQSAESILRNTVGGEIDVGFWLVGEQNAADNDSQATVEGYIDDVIGGYAVIPTVIIACSPIDIDATPDSQRLKVSAAFDAKAAQYDYFFHVNLGSVSDDEGLSPSHMVLDATIEAARDLIVAVWKARYPS